MKPKKILIVEDDKMLCKIFEMFVVEIGYKLVGICSTGNEAIEICKNETPDIILMDIYLHGDLSGIDTSKHIAHDFDIPVVFLTSDNSEETIRNSIYYNTYGFLPKPTNKDALFNAIEFSYYKHKYVREHFKKF